MLLDKFVKRVSVDGGLTVTAPFAINVRGTYFDRDSNVDSRRNRLAKEELYLARKFPPVLSIAPEEQLPEDHRLTEEDSGEEEPDVVAESVPHDEVEKPVETCLLGGSELPSSSVLPLHLLMYGRSYHRLDSYSIMRPEGDRHCTHMHVCDAITLTTLSDHDLHTLDAQRDGDSPELGMFLQQHYSPGGRLHGLRPCGSASLWLPHRLRTVFPDKGAEVNREGDKMVSEAKFYLPQHLDQAMDHGIRAVFLVPTCLSRVSLKVFNDSEVNFHFSCSP